MTEKIFISSERPEFQWDFQKNVTYDNIKSHKKPGLHPLSRRYIFGKTTGGVKGAQIDLSASILRVNKGTGTLGTGM